jgi:hypothetical protein
LTPAYEGSNPASPVDYSSRISEKAGVWLLFVCREYIYGETGEKMEIFGFNFKSKAEKEKEARDYMERVFPGGEKEREQVRQELTKRLPEKDETDLLLCYVHIRDRMTGTGLSFEQVAGEVEKLQWIPDMDQKSLDAIREVMEQVCAEHKK